MTRATDIGQAGLQGWRAKVGNGIADPIARRTSIEGDQVRAAVGALFFVLSVIYVVKTIGIASKQMRES
jgi:hypothetical protein